MSDEWVRREAAQQDFYWWWQSHIHELEIAAALDEAERIAKRAEQNRVEGQLDLFGEN
jgi:predicted alpha-1,6-mannanase (GH76 family)